MTAADTITAVRVLIAFSAVSLLAHGSSPSLAAILIGVSVLLDALDGPVARWRGTASDRGAKLDILADRIVESSLFVWFAATGQVSAVIPIAMLTRGCLIDYLRSAPRAGWMASGAYGQAVVSSRVARGIYGAVKMACFMALSLRSPLGEPLAVLALTLCLLRAIPPMLTAAKARQPRRRTSGAWSWL